MSDVPPEPLPASEPSRETLEKQVASTKREAQGLRGRLRDAEERLGRYEALHELSDDQLGAVSAMVREAQTDAVRAAAEARRWADTLHVPEPEPPKEPPMTATPPDPTPQPAPAAAADPAASEFAAVAAEFQAAGLTADDLRDFGRQASEAKAARAKAKDDERVEARAQKLVEQQNVLADLQALNSHGVPTDTSEGQKYALMVRAQVLDAGVPLDAALQTMAEARVAAGDEAWSGVLEKFSGDATPDPGPDGAPPAAQTSPITAASPPQQNGLPGPAIAPRGSLEQSLPDVSRQAKERQPRDMTPREQIAAAAADPKYGFDEATQASIMHGFDSGVAKMAPPAGIQPGAPTDDFLWSDDPISV